MGVRIPQDRRQTLGIKPGSPAAPHLVGAGDGQPVEDRQEDLRGHDNGEDVGETHQSEDGSVPVHLAWTHEGAMNGWNTEESYSRNSDFKPDEWTHDGAMTG